MSTKNRLWHQKLGWQHVRKRLRCRPFRPFEITPHLDTYVYGIKRNDAPCLVSSLMIMPLYRPLAKCLTVALFTWLIGSRSIRISWPPGTLDVIGVNVISIQQTEFKSIFSNLHMQILLSHIEYTLRKYDYKRSTRNNTKYYLWFVILVILPHDVTKLLRWLHSLAWFAREKLCKIWRTLGILCHVFTTSRVLLDPETQSWIVIILVGFLMQKEILYAIKVHCLKNIIYDIS